MNNMDRYLHLFETDNNRIAYEGGNEYLEPYVSLVNETNTSHYNVFKAQLTLTNGRVITIPRKGVNADSGLTRTETEEYKEDVVDVVIGSRIKQIGMNCFSGFTSLQSVDFSDSVIRIDNTAFYSCKNITSVVIPSGVTGITWAAFMNCTKLSTVTVLATTPPIISSPTFQNNASGRKIYVPSESVEAYKTATNWSSYANDILPIP